MGLSIALGEQRQGYLISQILGHVAIPDDDGVRNVNERLITVRNFGFSNPDGVLTTDRPLLMKLSSRKYRRLLSDMHPNAPTANAPVVNIYSYSKAYFAVLAVVAP